MTNWLDPEVVAACQKAYVRFVLVLVGIFLYYFCMSLRDVELLLLRGRQKLVPPHVPYLIGRYAALVGALLTVLISGVNYSDACARMYAPTLAICFMFIFLPSQGMLKGLPIVAAIVVACSSTNIMFRPYVSPPFPRYTCPNTISSGWRCIEETVPLYLC